MTVLFNLKTQKQIRKNLRKQEVESEKNLWWKLRDRQLGNYKFRRQFGIDKYIVDFYCPKLKLVIEIDGATHSTKKEIEYDNLRQGFLENLGLVIKRYTNNEVKNNLQDVLRDVNGLKHNVSSPRGPDISLLKSLSIVVEHV